MSSVKSKKPRLNLITREQCERWAGLDGSDPELAGTIHPMIIGKEINPNSTAKNSHNVLISNACASKYGIIRPGNPYTPVEIKSIADSNEKSSMLSSVAQNTKYDWVKDILFSDMYDDITKIHKLLIWIPDDNYKDIWHPPYYGKDDIREWIDVTKSRFDTSFDNFQIIESNFNDYKIYSGFNHKIYFKTILYAFVYGFNLNFPCFHHENPKQFIKLIKKIFVEYKITSLDFKNTIQKDFYFLFYPAHVGIKKFSGLTNRNYEQRQLYERNIQKNNSNQDNEVDIMNYFIQTLRKYNRSIKSMISYKYLIRDYDLEEHNSLSPHNLDTVNETSCIETIKSIKNEKYEVFKNNMMRACNKYSDIKSYEIGNQANLRKLTSNIQKHLEEKHSTRKGHVVVIDMRTPLKSLFTQYLGNLQLNKINILHLPKSVLRIKIKTNNTNDGVPIDVGENLNQVIDEIATQLFDKQIFIKSDIDKTENEKYFINPQFKIQDIGIDTRDINAAKALTDDFWKFIGSLCQFFLINNYKFPQKFSSFILSGFLNEHFVEKESSFAGLYTSNTAELKTKHSDLVYYLMRDFPQFTNRLIEVINGNIEDSGISLNSHLYLEQRFVGNFLENESVYERTKNEITNENYESYLYDLAKNIYILNPIKDDNRHNSFHMYVKFFAGINGDIKKGLRRIKITLDTLDDALS